MSRVPSGGDGVAGRGGVARRGVAGRAAASARAVGRTITLVAALAIGLLPGLVVPASAAGTITFGDPSATSDFGTGITFSQPVTAAGVDARTVEILIEQPGLPGPEVHPIAQVGNIASATFEFHLNEADQHIYPNTRFTARWRVIDSTGAVTVGPPTSITYADTRFQWQTATGPLVSVHWYKGDAAFGRRALAIGEAGVAKAEQLLGVTETEPVDFYVYADLQAFYDALGPGTRENVGGEALPEIRTLFGLITPDQIDESWVGIVIPHELTHLVFDTAVRNPYHDPPHWLNEGLAVYLTQGYDASDQQLVRDAVRASEVIPLPGLEGQFPTRRDKFGLAYAESVSAVDYMVRTYGRDSLVKLIGSYAAGVTDDDAFSQALGVTAAAFNDAWLASIGAGKPQEHGPLPAPAGPLPSGWSSSPAPAASGTPAPSGSPVPSGATSSPAGSRGPAGSGPLPTLAGGTATPVASGGTSIAPSLGTLPTPGSVSGQPATRGSDTGVAWLFALVAIVLAAVGIAVFAFRRRSPGPR